MRQQGILKQWTPEKGFGFIRPDEGGKDIFIHISAFPKDGVNPRIGEKIRYEVSADHNGKPKAVHIERLDITPITSRAAIRNHSNKNRRLKTNIVSLLIGILVVIGIVYTVYGKYQRNQLANQSAVSISTPAKVDPIPSASPQFSCDGRQHCSQMHSYEEAVYFIHHCPGTQMDGDNDGEPCESQFKQIF